MIECNNFYEAKFIREKKDRPTDWVIRPCDRSGKVSLIYIGKKKPNKL